MGPRMSMENVSSNPCVGCGPSHPVGSRLAFEALPDGASTRFVAEPRWQGFPGRMHSAILYLALIETMNWALYAKTRRMGLPARTSALTMTRRVVVGDEVRVQGRVLDSGDITRVEAMARTPAGDVIGSLDRHYRMVDEAESLRVMA